MPCFHTDKLDKEILVEKQITKLTKFLQIFHIDCILLFA